MHTVIRMAKVCTIIPYRILDRFFL